MRFASYVSRAGNVLVHPEGLPCPKATSLSPFTALADLPDFITPTIDLNYNYSKELQRFLQGKLLLLSELPYSIQMIHTHYIHGYVSYVKPIVKQENRYECKRCNNQAQHLFALFQCARCDRNCVYCRKCIMLGRVSECTPLIYWTDTNEAMHAQPCSLHWKDERSEFQWRASRAVKEAIQTRHDLLIWAVTGAGKTEMVFHGLETAFANGLRVCFATPRVDVVLELVPRFKQSFPTIDIEALYGGSNDRAGHAPFIITTTHQLLRFRQTFDVMIVDEVDAFPYSFDSMLAFAVTRAKKEQAATIYLSATPDESLQRQVTEGNMRMVKIPLRYHGHPLPVPRHQWCGDWQKAVKKERLPKAVHAWCEDNIQKKRQCLLFVPSVNVLDKMKTILAKLYPNVDGVHADDPERKEKVQKFRNGVTQVLVTTTILERGVTLPKIDVAVIGAESDIFTDSALVQIAGRVGRSAHFPTGDVCFFHFGKTNAMTAAIRQIETMNAEAQNAHKSV